MTRDCMRCRRTLPIEDFPHTSGGNAWMCSLCWAANPAVQRVANIAADALVRLRAIDALLYLGHIQIARRITSGLSVWPSIRELREGKSMPRQPLWWISFDPDTIALLRMLLRTPDPDRTPILMPA